MRKLYIANVSIYKYLKLKSSTNVYKWVFREYQTPRIIFLYRDREIKTPRTKKKTILEYGYNSIWNKSELIAYE